MQKIPDFQYKKDLLPKKNDTKYVFLISNLSMD